MKKAIAITMICVLFFWVGRIYNINQNPPITTYYNIGDTIQCGDLELSFSESHIDELKEFNERFGNDYSTNDEIRIISICINVTNKSNNDINWDDVMDFLGCGFESSVWASAIDPNLGSMVNRFSKRSLASGKTQKIWFLSQINKICFKDTSWNKLNSFQFSYVLSLSPSKIAVRVKA